MDYLITLMNEHPVWFWTVAAGIVGAFTQWIGMLGYANQVYNEIEEWEKRNA